MLLTALAGFIMPRVEAPGAVMVGPATIDAVVVVAVLVAVLVAIDSTATAARDD
jgi:hypothetical protein